MATEQPIRVGQVWRLHGQGGDFLVTGFDGKFVTYDRVGLYTGARVPLYAWFASSLQLTTDVAAPAQSPCAHAGARFVRTALLCECGWVGGF